MGGVSEWVGFRQFSSNVRKVTCSAGVAVSSSVLTIAVLSADRLLAVRRPLSLRVYRASRHAWLIVAGVWMTSLAIAAPLLDVLQLRVIDLGIGTHSKFSFCYEVRIYAAVLYAASLLIKCV